MFQEQSKLSLCEIDLILQLSFSISMKINTLLLLSQVDCSIRKDEVADVILKYQSDFAISSICNGW